MSDKKIFDDFPDNGCNTCERWWTNQCDGKKESDMPLKGSKLSCTSFLPIRSVTIPQEIEKTHRRVKCALWLSVISLVISILNLIYILVR